MKKWLTLLALVVLTACARPSNPVADLLERIDAGASQRIDIELVESPEAFFEIDVRGGKPVIRSDSYVHAAVGLNWYLKHYCGIHLSWNGMTAELPAELPLPEAPERHTADLDFVYDFNYCTYSYSMAFWDWDRWERELDWMALHGVDLPLAAPAPPSTGTPSNPPGPSAPTPIPPSPRATPSPPPGKSSRRSSEDLSYKGFILIKRHCSILQGRLLREDAPFAA